MQLALIRALLLFGPGPAAPSEGLAAPDGSSPAIPAHAKACPTPIELLHWPALGRAARPAISREKGSEDEQNNLMRIRTLLVRVGARFSRRQVRCTHHPHRELL